MLWRIIFPVSFVMAAIVAVVGVLIYTQEVPADTARVDGGAGGDPAQLAAAAMTAFQSISAVFTPVVDAEPAVAMIADIATLDALAAGSVPQAEPEAMPPATPFVRRAGAADATASNSAICTIEAGVRRCRIGS